MQKITENILLLLLLICSSCSSTYQFAIEVQEPAPVTLPVSAQNVLILNNTVVQPTESGIDRMFNSKPIRKDYPISLDSMVWAAKDEIESVLYDSDFFKNISIYNLPLRTDSEWVAINELSADVQADIYDMGEFDVLFVINRLLFYFQEDVKLVRSSYYEATSTSVNIRVDGSITCSMYLYGREKPLTTFSLTENIQQNYIVVLDSTVLFKELPEFMIDKMSRLLGNKAAQHFIPTWKTTERVIFIYFNVKMQEAARLALNRQWANAELIWQAEYQKKTKPIDKARLAFNLAVANEMNDKLREALEWAKKAKGYLNDVNQNKYKDEIEWADTYISELDKRIYNNVILDLQWGKE